MSNSTRALLDASWRAQARIGSAVATQSLTQWQRVSPFSLVESGTAWLTFMVGLIRGERTRSRQTAAAFYRLYRAYETGRTLPPLAGDWRPETVTLGDLRSDWARVTGTIYDPSHSDAEVIDVDDFEWPEEPTERHERATAASLTGTGPGRVLSASRGQRLDDPDFLAELNDVMNGAGTISAGAADREALRGGRDLINETAKKDKVAVGWARVTDGDPCPFCAMLASRGAIYRSAASAGIKGLDDGELPPVHRDDLEKYHNNCHCQTVPVFSRNDFMTPEAKEYSRQWREVTRGKAGNEALTAWRHHIDAQRRARRS